MADPQESEGGRPGIKHWPSWCNRLNQRLAIDTTHQYCGRDSWCHFTAVIDCFNREIVGRRFSRHGIVKVAAAALEDALLHRRFGPMVRRELALRSDNGLVFDSKAFPKVLNRFGLQQEFITPYTPQQNGMIDPFFRSFHETLIWQNRFPSVDDASEAIADWMTFYNEK